MSQSTAAEILNRFLDEQEHIVKYAAAASQLAHIDDLKIRQINSILKRTGLGQIAMRNLKERRNPYTETTIESLLCSMSAVEPVLAAKIRSFDIPDDEWLPEMPPEYEQWYIELSEWLLENLFKELPSNLSGTINSVYDQIQDRLPERSEELNQLSELEIKKLIKTNIEEVNRSRQRAIVYELESIRLEFGHIRLAARMQRPSSEINILRQVFILLMTAFDAAVFDVTRVALHNNLFALLPSFGKAEHLSISKMAAAGSWDQFSDKLITDILDGLYIRALLMQLRSVWKGFFDDKEDLLRVVELVRRRNTHIHNRGIVGESYLDRDKNGEPYYNVYSFMNGDVASIDPEYWADANRRCTDAVMRLAAWADTKMV